jgi:hypothetical protein
MKYFSSVFASSSAAAIAPAIPSAPGVRISSAPYARSSSRRSTLIVSGIVSTQGIPRAAHTIASAIPVFATGRLQHDGVRPDQAGLLRGVDHRHPDAVLHAVRRIEELELRDDLGHRVRQEVPDADQRRVADQFGDVVGDALSHAISFHSGAGPQRVVPRQQRCLSRVKIPGRAQAQAGFRNPIGNFPAP